MSLQEIEPTLELLESVGWHDERARLCPTSIHSQTCYLAFIKPQSSSIESKKDIVSEHSSGYVFAHHEVLGSMRGHSLGSLVCIKVSGETGPRFMKPKWNKTFLLKLWFIYKKKMNEHPLSAPQFSQVVIIMWLLGYGWGGESVMHMLFIDTHQTYFVLLI